MGDGGNIQKEVNSFDSLDRSAADEVLGELVGLLFGDGRGLVDNLTELVCSANDQCCHTEATFKLQHFSVNLLKQTKKNKKKKTINDQSNCDDRKKKDRCVDTTA